MFQKAVNQVFNLDVTTKGTLFGASADEFSVSYAPANDLTQVTEVSGGCSEFIRTIDNPRQIKVSQHAPAGSRVLHFDPNDKDDSDNPTTTIKAGDVIEYATGKYVMVLKVINGKAYLKRPIKVAVSAGTTLQQAGNTGIYKTPDMSMTTAGDYIVMIYAPEHNVFIEERVTIVDTQTHYDGDAPDNTTAVAV